MPATVSPVTAAQKAQAASMLTEYERRRLFWGTLLESMNGGILPSSRNADDLDAVSHFKDLNRAAIEHRTNLDLANKAAGSGYNKLSAAAGMSNKLSTLTAEKTRIEGWMTAARADIISNSDPATVAKHSRALTEIEKAMANGKTDKALRMLKSAEPGWFMRTFRGSDARAISADLARIRETVINYKAARTQYKELSPRVAAAEKAHASSLRSALSSMANSREVKALLSNPIVHAKAATNPSLAFILEFCDRQQSSLTKGSITLGKLGGMSNTEIVDRLKTAGGTITPQSMAAALQDLKTTLAPELRAARKEANKADIRYTNIKRYADSVLLRQKYEDSLHGQVGAGSAESYLNQILYDPAITEDRAEELLARMDKRQTTWLDRAHLQAYNDQLNALVSTGAHAPGVMRPNHEQKFMTSMRAFAEAAAHHGGSAVSAAANATVTGYKKSAAFIQRVFA